MGLIAARHAKPNGGRHGGKRTDDDRLGGERWAWEDERERSQGNDRAGRSNQSPSANARGLACLSPKSVVVVKESSLSKAGLGAAVSQSSLACLSDQ